MNTKLKIENCDKIYVQKFAEKIGKCLKSGDSIFLYGPVGVGKTFFVNCLVRGVLSLKGVDDLVTSPTFNLVNIYNQNKDPIWHVDLYRLEHPTDINELGLEQAFFEAICLVEWPDILDNAIVERAIRLSIHNSKSESNLRDLELVIPKRNFNNECFYIEI